MNGHCAKCDELAVALEHVAILLKILQKDNPEPIRYQESLETLEACIRGYYEHDD